ncbi:MAG: hypothetical protein KDD41_13100 [Flavobacteriales bacterium]|nr:hypothetical protein [Flavobacteriales bacterium]
MKKVKVIGIILGILMLLLVITGVIFSTIYEDKVKAFIIEQINNSVNTKIDAKEVNFSVFRKFPYASLEFREVTAEEMSQADQKEELFNAQSVYLQFNIIDILRENYIIKKVQVEHGMVNIKIDKHGKDNYHFWKTSTDSSDLAVELEDLVFKEVNFYFLNQYKDMDMDVNVKQLSLSGNFSSDEYTLDAQALLFINQINEKGKSISRNKSVLVNTSLAVNNTTDVYSIQTGELAFQDLNFSISGSMKNKENGLDLDLQTKGNEMEIGKLFSLFPPHVQEKLNTYSTEGIITFNSSLQGELSAMKTPNFNAEFSITEGMVTEGKSDQSFTNIKLKGSFTNGSQQNNSSSKLVLNEVDADFGPGHLSGNYTITDLNNPYIEFTTLAQLDLATAKAFFKWDSLETATGQLELNLKYSGYVKELSDIKASELRKLNASGTAKLTHAQLKKTGTKNAIENINGSFRFNNNDVKVDTLKFTSNGNQFELEGKFNNLLAYLFVENEVLAVRTSFHANRLVLDDFLSDSESSSNYSLSLPKNVALNFRAKVDTFEFRQFHAENLKAAVELEDQVLMVTDLSFLAMQGEVKGNLAIDDSHDDKILITSQGEVNKIDIHEMFRQFENFGQKHILDENIRGITTTQIEFASVWDKQLKVDEDKIYVLADIHIAQGELIDYQPILALSKFIEVEELEHIKFDRMSTRIEIKNRVVHIPKTEINSSAIDVTLSGTHTFDNQIDYRFKLLLNDVLWGKAKRKKKEITEFGYIADDGLGKTTLFLKMTGTVDDYNISYDTKGLKESWGENLKKEKNTLKKILNEEFGWFKKDTTIKKDETPKDDGLMIEWEEDDNPADTEEPKKEKKSTETKSKNKEKKGLGKFIDKVAKPDEEEYENFEDL